MVVYTGGFDANAVGYMAHGRSVVALFSEESGCGAAYVVFAVLHGFFCVLVDHMLHLWLFMFNYSVGEGLAFSWIILKGMKI